MKGRGAFNLALVIAAMLATAPVRAAPAPETAVKATYLYKFAPFVTWPVAGSGPVNICIVGDDPFGADLDRAVAGQTLDGRPFQIVRVDTIGPQSTCPIAFIAGSRAQSVAAALKAVYGAPVLTVTDEGTDAGIIAFAMQDDHVRFRIDQEAAQDGGLVISSQLLSLALSVRTKRALRP